MNGYDKNKELSYLKYCDVNNIYGWAMLQKLSVNNFEWREDTSQFHEDFLKSCNEESDEGYFLRLIFSILKNCMNFIVICYFYPKERKIKMSKSLLLIYLIKLIMLFT